MKLTTTIQVSVDGVMQGNGGLHEIDRRTGFERGGWARPLFDAEAMAYVDQLYQRADAFLFGRKPTRSSPPRGALVRGARPRATTRSRWR